MIVWFSCVPLELSPCSLNVLPCMGGELAKGEEKSTGLLSSYPAVSANGNLSTSGGASVFTSSSLAVGTSSLVLISTPFSSGFWVLYSLLSIRVVMSEELLFLLPNPLSLQPSSIRL